MSHEFGSVIVPIFVVWEVGNFFFELLFGFFEFDDSF